MCCGCSSVVEHLLPKQVVVGSNPITRFKAKTSSNPVFPLNFKAPHLNPYWLTMPFTYTRTIRFQDTDAAGVVYFANVLAMCHEAYEESLAASGINLQSFFQNPAVAIPIVHASVDFFRPMFCGDQQTIHLTPEPLTNHEFEIIYQVFKVPSPPSQMAKTSENDVSGNLTTIEKAPLQLVGKAITRHVCIDSANRTRKEMPAEMIQWLQQWSRPLDDGSD